jgi:ABC-2 type transport system ATP-binding protein
MTNTIEITNLTKEYGDFRLRDVSFSLEPGYIMGLIGPNGAGKTTIIKLLMNLLIRDGGDIKLFGMDILENEIEVKSRIGFVYDTPNFYDHLNLRQIKNIIKPFYKDWDDNVFSKLVQKFELPLNKTLKKFSHGMVMKAAIALALSHNADLIIMDEPTSGLDPVFRRELLSLLYELLQNENKSILFSTHITSDIERIADYITFIQHGEIKFSKMKDEVVENYKVVKGPNELINLETSQLFKGVKSTEFGFEALTDDEASVRQKFTNGLVIEKASLEDILYYHNLKRGDEIFN